MEHHEFKFTHKSGLLTHRVFYLILLLLIIPISLLLTFEMGRLQANCTPVFVSKYGLLKTISVFAPDNRSSRDLFSLLFPKPITFSSQKRAILFSSDSGILSVVPSAGINLSTYNTHRVVLTGYYTACNKTIILNAPQNITLFR